MWSSSTDTEATSSNDAPSLYMQLSSSNSSPNGGGGGGGGGGSEAVRKQVEQLSSDLGELRREIETNELVYDITYKPHQQTSSLEFVDQQQQQQQQQQHHRTSYTSVSMQGETAGEQMACERRLYFERLFQVNDVREPFIQADRMRAQMSDASTLRHQHTEHTLPLVLHQFFVDRLEWAINAKHAHLLRWSRFNHHTSLIEDNYVHFKSRIGWLLSDYNDAWERASRLNAARDALLLKSPPNSHSTATATPTTSSSAASSLVQVDDVCIYMRWLITHIYAHKYFAQFVRMVEWLPCEVSTELFALAAQPRGSSHSSSTAAIVAASATGGGGGNNSLPASASASFMMPHLTTSGGMHELYDMPAVASTASDSLNNFHAATSSHSMLNNNNNNVMTNSNANIGQATANSSARQNTAPSPTINPRLMSRILDNIFKPKSNGLTPADDIVNSISFRAYTRFAFLSLNS